MAKPYKCFLQSHIQSKWPTMHCSKFNAYCLVCCLNNAILNFSLCRPTVFPYIKVKVIKTSMSIYYDTTQTFSVSKIISETSDPQCFTRKGIIYIWKLDFQQQMFDLFSVICERQLRSFEQTDTTKGDNS